jgi:hypothetical protein
MFAAVRGEAAGAQQERFVGFAGTRDEN